MWIFLNNAFLSIVEEKNFGKQGKKPSPDLLVRARFAGDIERVFPHATVKKGGGTDYAFRAIIRRDLVTQAIAMCISKIDYSNFKNSVEDHDRHDGYMRVWTVMSDEQRRAERPTSKFLPKRRKGGMRDEDLF